MKKHNINVRDLRNKGSVRKNEPLRYGKAAQSPMAEQVGNINLHNGAGDDTDTQGHPDETVEPKSRRAADINGVDWQGE